MTKDTRPEVWDDARWAAHLGGLFPRAVAARVQRFGGESQAALAAGVEGDGGGSGAAVRSPFMPDGSVNPGAFTDRARACLNLGRALARRLGHRRLDTGHLLFGTAQEGHGVGGHVLSQAGITADAIAEYLTRAPGAGAALASSVALAESPVLARVLAGAASAALALGGHHVGTEHLLISLMRDVTSYAVTLCELCCVSAHQVVKNTLLLCAGVSQPEVVYNLEPCTPHCQIIATSVAALRKLVGDAPVSGANAFLTSIESCVDMLQASLAKTTARSRPRVFPTPRLSRRLRTTRRLSARCWKRFKGWAARRA